MDQEQFDPSEHTVREVLAYLDSVDGEEAARVLAAEEAEENRKTILAWAPPVDDDDDVAAVVVEEPGVDDRPVWNRQTHGNPPYGRESQYRVV